MLTGTTDLYHLMPPSLTVAWGHKVSRKQNHLASFLVHFATDQDEIWRNVEAVQVEQPDSDAEWTFFSFFFFFLINCFFADFKKGYHWHVLAIHETIKNKICMLIGATRQHFHIGLGDLYLGSRSKRCKKAQKYAPIISPESQSLWIECGVLSRLLV